MKRVILLTLFFLFIVNFCIAAPEIKFQNSNFQPTETIIGTIIGSDSDLQKDDLKIYEGRREVFFERDLAKINGTYYFYIIPPKEGNFSLEINNVLYNGSSGIASLNLQKNFSVYNRLDENNKTRILTIRPGFYVGDNPSIELINSGEGNLNLSIDQFLITLSPGDSRKINDGLPYGLYFLRINSYIDFIVPIINYGAVGNTSYGPNSSTINYSVCIKVDKNTSITHVVDSNTTYSLVLENVCNFSVNATILSELNYISFNENILEFLPNEIKNTSFHVDTSESGVFVYSFYIVFNENFTSMPTIITIFNFKNETSATNFNQTYNSPGRLSCEQRNGTFCTQEQSCSSDNYDYYPDNPLLTCCFSGCIGLGPKTNWNNILIGLACLIVIAGILYLLYRRSKKIKTANPDDKFMELDKKYQKNIVGKKK